MKIVQITEPKQCDFCDLWALFDGKTVHGPWANMCIECYRTESVAYPYAGVTGETQLAFLYMVS
jgi:hypothetical protein